jgi:alkylation response protein AidB-like acyl-CoA dehydrogenase
MWLTPLRAFGTEEQKGRWLSRTLRGEITVVHAISEPRGGSDLAGQKTEAVKDGDGYMVTGEKGYIHGPFKPDFLFMLVNTDPAGPKYENLSTVIMDVDTDGVTFKKGAKTLMGTTDSNAIMEKVWVSADRIVGGEGNGWEVAQCMIDVERGGPGVTTDQRDAIEQRERDHWGK